MKTSQLIKARVELGKHLKALRQLADSTTEVDSVELQSVLREIGDKVATCKNWASYCRGLEHEEQKKAALGGAYVE